MTALLLLAAVLVVLFIHAAWKTFTERWHKVGGSRIIARWLLGRPWHGGHVTNAGWRRAGTKALTPTGHASRFHHRPGWQRALMRGGPTLAAVFTLVGLAADPAATETGLKLAAAAAVTAAALYAWLRFRNRRHRRSTLYPLHLALARHLDMALPAKPESWLKVERDRSRAQITLPAHFDADPHVMDKVVRAAAARLGLESPEPTWMLAGPEPRLMLEAAQPPPARVSFLDIKPALDDASGDEIMLGIGRKARPVAVSLHGDSPHLLLSIGSGGGKSVTCRAITAPFLHGGAVALILDFPKLVSLQCFRGLPNVAYCDTAALVHSGLMWLDGELERRAQVVRATADIEGRVHAKLPRLVVVAEESNALMNRLRKYWADIRQPGDPKRSPAVEALELALLMGRQLNVIVAQVAQMGSVRATGSGEARENMAARILGRSTENAWKMLAGEFPYPGRTRHPGRVYVVTDTVRECQVASFTGLEARQHATSGTVTPCPYGMPGAVRVLMRNPLDSGGSSGPDQALSESGGPDVLTPGPGDALMPADPVSLSEAAGLGVGGLHELRKAVQRDPAAPEPVGMRGKAYLYSLGQLTAWQDARRSR